MSKQLSPSVTHPTLAEVYQNIRAKKLVLRPDFQRRFVWTHEHQEEFLDTILRGYPFPEIYVCRGDIDVVNLTTTQHVIDGQQRLTTIQIYIEGKQERSFQKIPTFAELSDDDKKEFLSYQLVMRDLGEVDDTLIREIFRRINLTKFKLEDVEIHNAVYDGDFIQTAKEVLASTDLRAYDVFHESEFTRMADLHFILLVMSTLENGGYFPQDNEVENYIAKFNEEYPGSSAIKDLLARTFAAIDTLGLPVDTIWFRKSNFFTMVVEFARHNAMLPTDVTQRLLELEQRIIGARLHPDTEFGKYYGYMYTGTAGRKARIERATVFNKYVFGEE
ncbi:DUF262 domain-containing protein [bacterium]|nr:DUF262 domain-containing protein [bacterium]